MWEILPDFSSTLPVFERKRVQWSSQTSLSKLRRTWDCLENVFDNRIHTYLSVARRWASCYSVWVLQTTLFSTKLNLSSSLSRGTYVVHTSFLLLVRLAVLLGDGMKYVVFLENAVIYVREQVESDSHLDCFGSSSLFTKDHPMTSDVRSRSC